MARVQLALNVADLDGSVDFYRSLFGVEPHKRRPGYANFEVSDPPLKLVLIEIPGEQRGTGTQTALNHLGVEVSDTAQVTQATKRLTAEGLTTTTEQATTCCYAEQDKVWVSDPAGTPWEVYTITDDDPADAATPGGDGACCTSDTVLTVQSAPTGVAPAATACC